MTSTPPRPLICERPSEELVEDLCIELRHVACGDCHLPVDERGVAHVREVAAIFRQVQSRGVDCRMRLEILTQETKGQILRLLDVCLADPDRVLYVRELDGIRRSLRCQLCRQAEGIQDSRPTS